MCSCFIMDGLCAGFVWLCAEVLLRVCPIHLSPSSAKSSPARLMYHDVPRYTIIKDFLFIQDFPL